MHPDPKSSDEKLKQLDDESNASLSSGEPKAPDAPGMSDRKGSAFNERMTQTGSKDREVQPEFGDSADPTQEGSGRHHRDE